MISGARIQKLHPYPSWSGCSRFGSVSAAADWQGLAPLSSLSFSRSAVWAEPRKLSASGWSVLPPPDSRRQRALNEPHELCTRLVPQCGTLVRVPRGDWRLLGLTPTSSQTTPPDFTAERFPFARIRAPNGVYGIESGDYSSKRRRITSRSLPRTWRAILMAPRSTGHERDGW